MRLTDFKVLTFDCYGTLIDWESGMFEALRSLVAKAARKLSRDEILEAHARHESAQQIVTPAKPYQALLAVVYKRLAEDWGVPVGWDECVDYGRSVRDWPAFADTAAALRYLKQHYKLVILSNVDNDSFSFSNRKLGVAFDAVFTAEDIGSYKPSPRNFEYMLEKLSAARHREGGHPAHGRKPLPRPRAGERFRPRHLLDPSPPRARRLRRDDEPGKDAAHRFPLHQHGGTRGRASERGSRRSG